MKKWFAIPIAITLAALPGIHALAASVEPGTRPGSVAAWDEITPEGCVLYILNDSIINRAPLILCPTCKPSPTPAPTCAPTPACSRPPCPWPTIPPDGGACRACVCLLCAIFAVAAFILGFLLGRFWPCGVCRRPPRGPCGGPRKNPCKDPYKDPCEDHGRHDCRKDC